MPKGNANGHCVITLDAARAHYERAGAGHGFDHVLRVWALAAHIAAAEGADPAVACTAALLHDIGAGEDRTHHHLRGAAMAREILRGKPPEFIEAVAHAIEAHRFRAEPAPRTVEAQVLSDADKLDAIGAIGIARVFAHAGARGTVLWPFDAAQGKHLSWREIAAAPGDAVSLPADLGANYTPVHEFVHKLDRIPERLYTATARAIAAERHAFMRAFFDRLDQEALSPACPVTALPLPPSPSPPRRGPIDP